MTDTDALPDPHIEPPEGPLPASETMAERLRVNRTGHLTPAQHRLVWIVGIGALVFMLCPLGLVLQMLVVILAGETPTVTLGGLVFTAVGAGFVVLILGLVGTNVVAFLGEALSPHPVRSAQGPLQIHVSSKKRPELPFSYIIGDYSFAPYLAPRDLPMRTDAPYVVYYGTKTRLLLSIAALDAPDADEWSPQFDQE